MGAHQGVTRAIAGRSLAAPIALLLAVVIALTLAACPSRPPAGTNGDGAHEGGERPADRSSPLPDSPLDPIRDEALGSAGSPAGAQVTALIVRADVAFATGDGGAALEWHRIGLILGSFGLRVFERAPRGVVRDDHGAAATDPSVAPIARALSVATPLTAGECATLPASACDSLSSLDISDSVATRPVRRVAIATVATLPRAE